jgi:lysine-specific permease
LQGFGETEYYLAGIKVVAIILFIIVGGLLDLGLIGNSKPIYFEYWKIPDSPIKNGITGIFQVFLLAFFAFGGTELIGLTAGEAINPQVNVPIAIKSTFYRILVFYIGSIFVMGLTIRHDDPSLLNSANSGDVTISPFTLILARAGLSSAAHIMNGVIFSAVLSAGNSAIYGILY